MPARLDLAAALAVAAAAINEPTSLTETLDRIVFVARDTMPDIDQVGVTLVHRDGGRLETAAATDDFVGALDELQYASDQGPCVDALKPDADPITLVDNARHEARWPRYIPPALRLGLTAQMGVRMFIGDATVGVLSMYATRTVTIDVETQQLPGLFATHAALAYGHVRQTDNLRAAMTSRERIGQATGILIHKYDLSTDRAFEYLVRVFASSELKLRVVADQIVDGANQSEPLLDKA